MLRDVVSILIGWVGGWVGDWGVLEWSRSRGKCFSFLTGFPCFGFYVFVFVNVVRCDRSDGMVWSICFCLLALRLLGFFDF